MKTIALIVILSVGGFSVWHRSSSCAPEGPRRLVVIKGKATILDGPGGREDAATSETLIFQKVGCENCYVGTGVKADGSYEILVGDGKYKVIVNRPSAPQVDLLAPNQERFIDTESAYNMTGVFTFDVKIKFPN